MYLVVFKSQVSGNVLTYEEGSDRKDGQHRTVRRKYY